MVHFWPNTNRHVRRPPLRSCLTACEKATWRGERNTQDNINKLRIFVLNHHLLSSPYRDIQICIDNNIDKNKKIYKKNWELRWLKTYICHMQLYILLIATNIALWIRANGTIRINNVWFQVARKCLNTMSAKTVGYVARKFVDKFRDMVPQNMFSTVRTGG